jgi:SAM-dependent methyltransferase
VQVIGAAAFAAAAVTAQHFADVGVGTGWRCWEAGSGDLSVPGLTRDRVGPGGQVIATDVETGWMLDPPDGVQVLRHDVVADDPPGDGFDLVHARLVLVHLPQRDEALRRMVASLRPGGWILLEDFDIALQPLACPEARRPVEHRANRIRAGFLELLHRRGARADYGRALPRLLRDSGLADVRADAFCPLTMPAASALEVANVEQVRAGLIGGGLATAEELDSHLAAVAAGRVDVATPPLIAAWGRVP